MSTRNSGVAQGVFARTYLPGQVQRSHAFDIGYDAFQLKYFDRRLYTCDLAVNQIIALDTSGREVARLGKKGMEAGSFKQIIGWGVDARGLYVADPSNGTVTQFNAAGAFDRQYKFNPGLVRAMRLQGDNYALKSNDKAVLNEDFRVVNIATGRITPMDKVYTSYNDGGFATDGFFIRSEHADRPNVHVSYRMGNFFCFDDAGKVAFKASTIEGHSAPPKVITSTHSRVIAPQQRMVNRTAAADRQFIYIVSNIKSKEEKRSDFEENSAVDVYRLDNGKYAHSFYIPDYKGEKVSDLCKVQDGFYAVQGRSVVHYQRSEKQINL